MLLHIIIADVLAKFTDASKRIRGIQIGDHEIKLANFADDTIIFLIDITCLNRIQVILKLHEEASSWKMNVSKNQALWDGAYKNKTDKPGQKTWSHFPSKYLVLALEILLSISPIGTK